ncbi:hypothetical protein SLA2020_265510 [Shorea laevis]
MGVGVIARKARGLVVVSMCTTIPFITDPSIAEAVAAWKVAVFCCDQGFPSVILEGDALEIVQAFRQEGPSWSRYGQIIAYSVLG